MNLQHIPKIKSTRSCLLPWFKLPAGLMVNLSTYTDARLVSILGSVRRPTAKRSTPIQSNHARTTGANPPSFAEWRGPDATVHLFHRDDGESTGLKPAVRLAI